MLAWSRQEFERLRLVHLERRSLVPVRPTSICLFCDASRSKVSNERVYTAGQSFSRSFVHTAEMSTEKRFSSWRFVPDSLSTSSSLLYPIQSLFIRKVQRNWTSKNVFYKMPWHEPPDRTVSNPSHIGFFILSTKATTRGGSVVVPSCAG